MPIVCRVPGYKAMALKGIFHSRRRESLLIAGLGELSQKPHHLGCPTFMRPIVIMALDPFVELHRQSRPKRLKVGGGFVAYRSRPPKA